MARIHGDILIDRPPEVVFDFVADERNEPRFNAHMATSSLESGEPIGEGSRFRTTFRSVGRLVPMTVELTGYERPRRLGSRSRTRAMLTEGELTFEPESSRPPACRGMPSWAATHETRVIASDSVRSELLRAARRLAPDRTGRARAVLDAMSVLNLSSAIFERAATLDPEELRSLDALHLAAALELGDEPDGVVTHDDRTAAAASLCGVAVMAPS